MRQPDRIIRLRTVLARTGLSRSTIYRKIADPVGWRATISTSDRMDASLT